MRTRHGLMPSRGLGISSPRRAISSRAVAAICAAMLLANCFVGVSPAQARSPLVATIDRPWLMESEFDANPALHATDGQTVVLYLEPRGHWDASQGNIRGRIPRPGGLRRNSIRFLVEEAHDYQFCIPADEPYLRSLTVRRWVGDRWKRGEPSQWSRPLIRAWRGGPCEPVTLRPGSYLFDAFHKVRDVLSGKTAFLRLPDDTRLTGDPLTAATATLSFMAWKGPNGKFVTAPDGQGDLVATATTVDKYTVWKLNGTETFQMTDGIGGAVQSQAAGMGVVCPAPLFIGPARNSPNCDSSATTFYFSEASATQFRLIGKDTAFSEDGLYGYDSGFDLDGSDRVSALQDPVNVGIEWTADYRGFTCTSGACDATQLQLQKGEVALFTEENYQGHAFVFASDIADFSIYGAAAQLGLAIADNQAASVRVGPDTLALLYTDASFGGAQIGTTEDIPSLAGLAVGPDQLASLRIEVARTYILASNGCAGCDLTGIDLSGLDLAGADFTGATLTDANLTGTSLDGATLDSAILTNASVAGADFSDTSLHCTNLSDNDFTAATFALTNNAVVSDVALVAILGVYPDSGDRFILAGTDTGGGEPLSSPTGIGAAPDGFFLVDSNRVLKVQDGDRTLVSSSDRGTGSAFFDATDVAMAADGSLIVTDLLRAALIDVDPATGDRLVLSGSSVGSGPPFTEPVSLAIAKDGTIYVADGDGLRVFAVDPSTGDRTVISGASTGNGPALQGPVGIAVDSDGSLLVTDLNIPALLWIDPVSGDRTVLSGSGTGDGPAFSAPAGLAVTSDGTILVVDSNLPGLFSIDRGTGDREILSAVGVGGGPTFSTPVDIALTNTRIATDFSCRLSLARSTFDLDAVPANLWRYLDLTGATIIGAQGATLSSAEQPLDLSGAVLNAVDLSEAVLDGANLGCASAGTGGKVCSSLQSTNLAHSSLKAATLSSAQLQGASLSGANLDGADLSSAKLLGFSGGSPATLSGAFLRGANLSKADLTGVIANYVNFYSFSGGTATATDAVMTGAKFNDAYMAGADFSDATLQSTEWTQAVLVGANFTDADLSKNETADEVTDFTSAYLHGTVFTNATVTDADFDGSYWDLSQADTTLNIQLQISNLGFAGYWNTPSAPECVQAAYSNTADPPLTDASNICPDGSLGPCNDAKWQGATIPISATTPPGAIDPGLPGSCTTTDLCWGIESTLCVP